MSYKSFITESKIKAEDFEAAIVMGWYAITNQPFDAASAGITDKVHTLLLQNPEYIEAGKRIAQDIKDHFKLGDNVKAEQYGRAKSGLTGFWKSFGATDTTPKTDILIGDKRLSLKIGMAQLMSGGKAESMATFNAAMEKSKIEESVQLKKVVTIFDDFVTTSLAPSQLRPLIKSGENEIVNRGESAHKTIMNELGTLFETNEKFKIEFAREAMSGFMKYGENNNAAAEFMVVSDHSGTSTKIKSVYDDGYCKQIADQMKLQARFKTSSRKLKGKKTGEYNFWSVISLIVDAKLNEEVETLEENAFRRMLQKVKGRIGGYLKKVSSYVRGKASNVLKFFGVTPDIKVNTEVKF
jgi:hypothetical protein